jgi:hypothetical protein
MTEGTDFTENENPQRDKIEKNNNRQFGPMSPLAHRAVLQIFGLTVRSA